MKALEQCHNGTGLLILQIALVHRLFIQEKNHLSTTGCLRVQQEHLLDTMMSSVGIFSYNVFIVFSYFLPSRVTWDAFKLLDKKIMGKDLKICICSIPSMQAEDPCEKGLSNKPEKSCELNTTKNDEQLEKGELDLNNEDPNAEKNQAVHLMGASTNGIDPHIESVVLDISNGLYNGTFMKDKAIHDNKERPFFEVILKRPRDVQDTENRAHDRNVMRHSDLSAFSRYRHTQIIHMLLRHK